MAKSDTILAVAAVGLLGWVVLRRRPAVAMAPQSSPLDAVKRTLSQLLQPGGAAPTVQAPGANLEQARKELAERTRYPIQPLRTEAYIRKDVADWSLRNSVRDAEKVTQYYQRAMAAAKGAGMKDTFYWAWITSEMQLRHATPQMTSWAQQVALRRGPLV